MYDTLMQMGRWFGYRPHYELFQRVWLTDDTKRKFELLTDIDMDLREQIYQMSVVGKGPEDFNLALLTSPKVSWMALTSKSKMQMATPAAVDFSGTDTQLTVYSKNKKDQDNNIAVTESFIRQLGSNWRKSENTEAYIWENVPFRFIVFKISGFESGTIISSSTNIISFFSHTSLFMHKFSLLTSTSIVYLLFFVCTNIF